MQWYDAVDDVLCEEFNILAKLDIVGTDCTKNLIMHSLFLQNFLKKYRSVNPDARNVHTEIYLFLVLN